MVYRGYRIAVTSHLAPGAQAWICCYRVSEVPGDRMVHTGTCAGAFQKQSEAEAVAMRAAMSWVDFQAVDMTAHSARGKQQIASAS